MLLNVKQKINNSMLICLAIFIWNTIYMIEALKMGAPIKKGQVDINFFPIVISILMYIVTFYLFFQSLKQDKEMFRFDLKKASNPLLIIIFTMIYILLLKPFGYMLYFICFQCEKKKLIYENYLFDCYCCFNIFVI